MRLHHRKRLIEANDANRGLAHLVLLMRFDLSICRKPTQTEKPRAASPGASFRSCGIYFFGAL
jgi:hypothetical protein